jgi:hypothetical protein
MAKVIDKELFFKKLGYTPHSAAQYKYHMSKARFRIPVCGRRFGKSKMAGTDLEPELFIPGRRYWIVGPTYDLGEKEFRVIWDDLIVAQKLGRDKRVKKAYNRRSGEMYIEFPWGTRVEVRSAEHPERLVGDSLDGVIMSEAAKHKRETWERFIRPALADRRGWATFPTTPEGHNWLYDLWLFGQDESIPAYESWRFPSWDNPVVYPEGRTDPEILLIEKTTSPEWFAQEIGADFSAFVGKIYDEFDEGLHVRKHEFNPAWPNYMAIDWGFVQPLAAVEFQIDPWQNVRIWREHYRSYLPLAEHVRLMQSREQPYGYHLDLAFADAADPEAALYISQHMVPCVADPNSKTNWRQGVDLVKTFMKPYDTGLLDEFETPILKPKFTVDPSCVHTIREHAAYRAKDNVSSSTNESSQRAPTIAQDDHTCDAIRYGLVHIFILGANARIDEVAQAIAQAPNSPVEENIFMITDNSPTETGMFTMEGMRF